MRPTFLPSIFLSAICLGPLPRHAAAAPDDPFVLLTKAETKQVDAVIDSVVAAGFPDGKDAAVYFGELAISATFNPAKDPPPLPSDASNMQETIPNSDNVTYGYKFDGLHFKLADGSWIISLRLHFTPRRGDKVNTQGAKKVDVANLTADALGDNPFDAEKDGGKWLERVNLSQRERTRATMIKIVPVLNFLNLSTDELAPAVVLLRGAGWGDAEELALALADQRSRNYWQLKPWTTADFLFDPTGAYSGAKDEEEAWRKEHTQFTSEPPAVALRRALFRWCRAQISVPDPERAMLSVKVAAAAAKASVDPMDPQGYAKRIDALAAGAKLPVTPPEKADLATRLQSWEARPREPKMLVAGGNDGNALTFTTSFTAPPPAYEPDKADLDALVALLADERPSRFSDFSGPRTLGDNAWRAVTAILKSDPRTLANYPTDHVWTSTERKSAAAAVQKWWKEHRTEYAE